MSREADLSEDVRHGAPTDLEDLALDADYALTAAFVDMVIDAADRSDGARIAELIGALRPEDVADLMGFLTEAYRAEIVPQISPDALPEILTELDDRIREEVLDLLPPDTLARAIEDLDPGRRRRRDRRPRRGAARERAGGPAASQERTAIEASLAYEDETAGRLMQREVALAPQFWTVGQAMDHLAQRRRRTAGVSSSTSTWSTPPCGLSAPSRLAIWSESRRTGHWPRSWSRSPRFRSTWTRRKSPTSSTNTI